MPAALDRPDGPARRRAARTSPGAVLWPEYMTQRRAADFLDVSVRWFQLHVDVAAVPVGLPQPGKSPMLRYRRADLEAWVERCAAYKLTRTA